VKRDFSSNRIRDRHEILFLFVSEESRLRHEAQAERYFERKARTPARRDIYRQVSVLPALELTPGDVELTTMDFANLNVTAANPEFTVLEAHG
jgi:hypothetical protein